MIGITRLYLGNSYASYIAQGEPARVINQLAMWTAVTKADNYLVKIARAYIYT